MAKSKKSGRSFVLKNFITLALSMVLVLGIFAYYFDVPGLAAETDEVLPGVIVSGVNLSNLERQEAIKRISLMADKLRQSEVTVVFNGNTRNLTMGELGLAVDMGKTIDRALALGKDLGFFRRWQAEVRPVEHHLPPVLSLDREKARGALQQVTGTLSRQPVDARLVVDGNEQVNVSPSENGWAIDVDKFCNQLIEIIEREEKPKINVPIEVLEPDLKADEVRSWGVTGLVASFTTNFKPEQQNRNHNIATAAKMLDGLKIKPGETVSFNDIVGPRDASTGYKEAGVIIGNKLEQGMGGGICQVSTTLYNAALLADLKVSERSSHSLPVSYVPIGRDAAVAYGLLDFKFYNNFGSYLLLETGVYGNSLTVKIYGNEDVKRTVHLNSWINKTIDYETIYEVDPEVPVGQPKVVQQGAPGFKAAAERIVFEGEREVKREALPGSYYQPVEHIVAVNSIEEIPSEDILVPNQPSGQAPAPLIDEGDLLPETPEISEIPGTREIIISRPQ